MVGLNWGKTIAMSTVATAELTQRPAEPDSPPAEADVWTRIDRWAAAASDWFNPILIKETRQALKSRQFLVTFSAILVASLGWTIAGSLSMMPQIYSQPSAARMLIGYYVVLAIPMMLVVPLAAYRSLEVEIDDGTLELLSISALSSWQIVLGKLASAVLQMLLYLVVLLPCVAYAYTLRGVDLPAVALMVAIVVAAASTVTVFALALAPVSRGRGGRIATLLVVLGTLLLVEYLIGYTVVILINEGNPLPGIWTAYAVAAATLVCGSGSYLLLTTTAALLTPESENRSTPVRIAMLIFTLTALGMAAFAIEAGQPEDRQSQDFAAGGLLISLTVLAVVWTYGGSLLVAESDQLTPRVTRTLPATMAGRAILTFPDPRAGNRFGVCRGDGPDAAGRIVVGRRSGLAAVWTQCARSRFRNPVGPALRQLPDYFPVRCPLDRRGGADSQQSAGRGRFRRDDLRRVDGRPDSLLDRFARQRLPALFVLGVAGEQLVLDIRQSRPGQFEPRPDGVAVNLYDRRNVLPGGTGRCGAAVVADADRHAGRSRAFPRPAIDTRILFPQSLPSQTS